MFRWSFLPLVFCFVYLTNSYRYGILPAGSTPIPVTGKKGGNATLTCKFNISEIELKKNAEENIKVCETENCTGRVFIKGACDVIIRNLSFSDAGTYFLTVYYDVDHNTQDSKSSEYHLHIKDEISGKVGEPLKLDDLLSNGYKVERNSSGEWREVWRRGHGVNSDRLTVSDETLIIKAFIANDAGAYRVRDSINNTLITVTVTESSPDSDSKGRLRDPEQPKPTTEPKGDLNRTGNTTSGTEKQKTSLIVGLCLGALGALGILVALKVLFKFDIRTCQRQQRPRPTNEEAELQEMNPPGHQAQDS